MRDRTILRTGIPMFIVAGILVAATIPLIPILIPSLAPSSVESGLQALQSQGQLYTLTWVFYLVSDLLYLVGFYALFVVLKGARRGLAITFLVLNTGFVALDVALDIPLRLLLVGLSNSYYSSSASNQASVLVTASNMVSESNLVALGATLLQFIAVILVSYGMLRTGQFRRSLAYVGFACGVVALLFIPFFIIGSQAAGLFNILGFVLLVVWSLGVGFTLRKLSSLAQ